jgi:hypothetical protein
MYLKLYNESCFRPVKVSAGDHILAMDINGQQEICWEINSADDDEWIRYHDMLEDYTFTDVLYTSNDEAKFVLIIKELNCNTGVAAISFYVCNSKEECDTQFENNTIFDREYIADGTFHETRSEAGTERHICKCYPVELTDV